MPTKRSLTGLFDPPHWAGLHQQRGFHGDSAEGDSPTPSPTLSILCVLGRALLAPLPSLPEEVAQSLYHRLPRLSASLSEVTEAAGAVQRVLP